MLLRYISVFFFLLLFSTSAFSLISVYDGFWGSLSGDLSAQLSSCNSKGASRVGSKTPNYSQLTTIGYRCSLGTGGCSMVTCPGYKLYLVASNDPADSECEPPKFFNPKGATCDSPSDSPSDCSSKENDKFNLNYKSSTVTCHDGCSVGPVGVHVITKSGNLGSFQYTGESCASGEGENGDASEVDTPPVIDESSDLCPKGTVKATFNNIQKCYDINPTNTYDDPRDEIKNVDTSETNISSTTTSTDENGTTTTTTTSTTTTSNSSSTTTTTTIKNADGSETTTTETEGSESLSLRNFDTKEGSKSFWNSNYENGLSGIWQSHQADLENTQIVSWLDSWEFPNSGQVPSFCFDFNMGMVNFGQKCIDMSFFTTIAPYLRAIFLLSSLLLARKLIFGG